MPSTDYPRTINPRSPLGLMLEEDFPEFDVWKWRFDSDKNEYVLFATMTDGTEIEAISVKSYPSHLPAVEPIDIKFTRMSNRAQIRMGVKGSLRALGRDLRADVPRSR